MVTRMTKNWSHLYVAHLGHDPSVKTASFGSVFGGSETGLGPFQMNAMFSKMNATPTAVINGTSLGAPRTGLYATRSIVVLRRPQTIIAPAREMRSTGRSSLIDGFEPRLKIWITTVAVTIPPIMKTSPWAKL